MEFFFSKIIDFFFSIFPMLFKERREIILSVIPEDYEGRTFKTHWYIDISACGSRSIYISEAKIVLSKEVRKLSINGANPLMPGVNHRFTERQPLWFFVKNTVDGIYIYENTGKEHKVSSRNLRLLKRLAREYDEKIKAMKTG